MLWKIPSIPERCNFIRNAYIMHSVRHSRSALYGQPTISGQL